MNKKELLHHIAAAVAWVVLVGVAVAVCAAGSEATTTDARRVLRHAAGVDVIADADGVKLDQNADGVLTTTDARVLLQKAAGSWCPPDRLSGEAIAPLELETLSHEELADVRVYNSTNTAPQVYLARSRCDLRIVLEQVGVEGVDLPTDDYFAARDVLVLLRVCGGSNSERQLQRVGRAGEALFLCDTTVHHVLPTPDINYRCVLIGVEKTQLQGVKTVWLQVNERKDAVFAQANAAFLR